MVHFARALAALTAGGLGVAVVTAAAVAKPPELPLDRTVTCAPAVQTVGDAVAAPGRHQFAAAAAGLCLPIEIAVPPEAETDCPYLRQKSAAPVETSAVTFDTPLGNLRKLAEAERLCEQAEFYLKTGRPASAIACFQLAAKGCPGSRCGAAATARMEQVRAALSAAAGQAECEEPAGHCCPPAGPCGADFDLTLPACIDFSAASGCCRLSVSVSVGAVRTVSIGLGVDTEPAPPIAVTVKTSGCCCGSCVGACLQSWLKALGVCDTPVDEKRPNDGK
jgi:hypothetical protein